MADLIATHAELARIGVDKFFPAFDANPDQYWQQVGWHTEMTTQEFKRMYQRGDFPLGTVVTESSPIPISSPWTGYNKDYYWAKRGIGYKCSYEKLETDQYNIVAKTVSEGMAMAMQETKESTAANVFNNATSTATPYVGPDGVALVSASHPYNGGTFSNLGTGASNTNVDLAADTLEDAIAKMLEGKSREGKPAPRRGPFKLMVPVGLVGIANRLVKSMKLPTTADNDINWAGGQISGIIVNPWLTDTDAWFLISANQAKHGLVQLTHGSRRVQKKIYEETENVAWFMTEKWLFHHYDARGVWGTAGA